jgi:methionine sulfoxide reductase heme-binding subunit
MSSAVIWYLNRSTGIVCLVLMTLTLVLGVVVQRQKRLPGLPRFGVVALHRNVSLLAALLLLTHITTAAVDSYVDVSWWTAFVPFVSGWRPFAVGLGTLSVDLLALVVVTSLLRGRIPHRWWRAVHWTSYLMWPLAFVHGLTAGTDLGSGWALALVLGCAGAAGGASVIAWSGRRSEPGNRAPAALASTTAALASGRPVGVFRNR